MSRCAHRIPGKWTQRWTVWLAGTVGSFAVLEGLALITEGSPATLSSYIRRLAGVDPRCQHCFLGRAALIAVLTWAGAHLGWGLFGWDGRR